jgi:cytochrome c5
MRHCKRSRLACGLLVWAAGVALTLSLQAAAPKVDVSKLPPAATKPGVTFDKDIKAIFERSCLKCHSGAKAKGDLRLDTREAALKGGEGGPVLVVGKSAQSPLIHYAADLVPDMEMPPVPKRRDFPALTKEHLGLLRAWVDQGAK